MNEHPESSQVKRLDELLKTFSDEQLDYVSVRPYVRYNKDAARAIGIAPETVSRWENKDDVEAAVTLIKRDGVRLASEMFRRHLPEAARVIIGLMRHRNPNMAFRAATEVKDTAMGKPTQRQEVTGKDGGDVVIRLNWGDNDDDTAAGPA